MVVDLGSSKQAATNLPVFVIIRKTIDIIISCACYKAIILDEILLLACVKLLQIALARYAVKFILTTFLCAQTFFLTIVYKADRKGIL